MRSASEKAFAALPNLKEAISLLSVLKGVGPATASAVLAVHTPSIAPFMSDEVRPSDILVDSFIHFLTHRVCLGVFLGRLHVELDQTKDNKVWQSCLY